MSKKSNPTTEAKRKKRQETLAKKRNKSLIVITSAFLAILFIVVTSFLVYQSDMFTVTNVDIKGNVHLSEGQIVKAAALPKHSNFFRFPVSDVEARVKTLPWVEDVKVFKSFPGGAVIQIREKKPFAYILKNNLFYIVDFKGNVISVENFKRFKLPMIERMDLKKITVGKKISDDNFSNMTKAFSSFPKDLKPEVSSIYSPAEEELTFVVKGVEIIYGACEKIEMKNSVVDKLLHSKKNENYSTIDVRVPTRPTVRVIGK